MRTLAPTIVVAFLLVMTAASVSSLEKDERKAEMKRLLPTTTLSGYRWEGKDEYYDRQTAFRYMDGAAELYRSFAFQWLIVRRYQRPNSPPIVVELFDMGFPEEAFGVFTFETGGEELGIGQGSDYGGGLLRFWKGRYFANVYAEQENPSTREDVLQIAEAIARSISPKGEKPKLVQYLPEEGLLTRTIRYFHLHQSLNYHYFISHENILRLGERTRALLASYLLSPGNEKTLLLLVQYPTKNLAVEALQSFLRAYMPEAPVSNIIKTENGKWVAAQSHQEYVLVVFDAPEKMKAEELMLATKKKIGAK